MAQEPVLVRIPNEAILFHTHVRLSCAAIASISCSGIVSPELGARLAFRKNLKQHEQEDS